MTPIAAIAYGSLALIGLALSVVTYTLAGHPPVVPAELGHRGLKRKMALEKGGLFRTTEPLIRLVAGWFSLLPLARQRRKVDKMLVHSGDWLGLSADELFAMCFLSGTFMMLIGIVLADMVGLGFGLALFFAVLGVYLPYTRLTGEIQDRFKSINRHLPQAIDLGALCMGAGLDFPGALRQVVDKSPDKLDPLIEELGRILQELDLGRTRRKALENFADRCPTDSVRDFVGAVVQAEEKGNPLAEVLNIQAHMLRMRRSIAAEESAAKAGVMMMAPLTLIFAAIILLLLGPFILNGMSTGF